MDNRDYQETINYLSKEGKAVFPSNSDMLQAIDMAIKSLERDRDSYDIGYAEGHADGVLQGKKLYAPKLGKWVDTASGYKCSVCGEENDYAYDEYKHKFTDYYCPNCGADMRGEVNKNDYIKT